ncbi:MAG: cytochrome c [Sulfuricella sp.]|nr:cytochrome c [Sulfuricella sp.]
MIRTTLFTTLLAAVLGLAASVAGAGELKANRTALISGETLELTYTSDKAVTQDVYLAIVLADGATFFMDTTGNFPAYKAGAATPARLSKPAAGSHKLLSFTVPEGFTQEISFYVAEGRAGSDILAGDTWNYDVDTRRSKTVSFQKRATELDGGSVSASTGKTLYDQHCAVCHSDPKLNLGFIQRGIDPKKTMAKNASLVPMKYLSKLSRDEIINIAAYIASAR